MHLYRTDWAKVSTDSDDSVDLPADATESALHNALTDMHRRGANVGSSSASADNGSKPEDTSSQGDSKSFYPQVFMQDLKSPEMFSKSTLPRCAFYCTCCISLGRCCFQYMGVESGMSVGMLDCHVHWHCCSVAWQSLCIAHTRQANAM